MTKRENLMVTAMEECAEVQQALSKCLRFGVNNSKCDDVLGDTNGKQVMKEYHQLKAVMDLLVIYGYIPGIDTSEQQEIYLDKVEAVKKYQEYSKKIGTLV